ncbi:hypothetical protein Tco_0666544 [Tanacetum coccineum]
MRVGSFTINPSPPLAFLTISPLKGVLGLCDLPGKGFVGVLGRWEWVGVSWEVLWGSGLELKPWEMAGNGFGGYGVTVQYGCRIGPSKSSQSLSIAHKWAVVID